MKQTKGRHRPSLTSLLRPLDWERRRRHGATKQNGAQHKKRETVRAVSLHPAESQDTLDEAPDAYKRMEDTSCPPSRARRTSSNGCSPPAFSKLRKE